MASVPEDLVAYLAPLVSETAGVTMFVGPPPELPPDLIALTHYGGEPAEDRVMGASLNPPGVEVAMVQLYVRNSVLIAAKSKADACFALLDSFNGTLSGRKYFNVEAVDSTPYSLGQNDRGLWMCVANFRAQHAR